MTKTYEFTTARGAQVSITITAEKVTFEQDRNLDGHKCGTDTFTSWQYKIDDVIVNGKHYQGEKYNLAWHVKFGMQGNRPLLIALPEDIINDFTAAERQEAKERSEKRFAADQKYEAQRAMVERAMRE